MEKILIANRGEIAVRITATARDMGYRTVAVYSESDAEALHVHEADEAVCIGAAPVGESYLAQDRILEAARKTGADAVHPGYGFLSENTDFARACAEAGLTFIGPCPEAIELMGSKRQSKLAMLAAGVPCIPGYQGKDQDDETLTSHARDIGFPLMVKASAGGGGRGMRLVERVEDLAEQITTARSEAETAFGSGELILEKAVLEPRHIEIQVFGDSHGNHVHLFERDCSVQRRHQKVIEEAPSPFVDDDLRARMGTAAVEAARACDYQGAGTVEFLVDRERNFYFLEMNTRLQVEHPVTEMITGLDLVEWQLRVAEGEALPLKQEDIQLEGHAVEARLYAEDPRQGFLPRTGTVEVWETPIRRDLRVDEGIQPGQQISPHYDPMIAKLIAWGPDRSTAVRRLASSLRDTALLGVDTNKTFLEAVLRREAFIEGKATTAFLADHFEGHATTCSQAPTDRQFALAAVVLYVGSRQHSQGWTRSHGQLASYRLAFGDTVCPLTVGESGDLLVIQAGDNVYRLEARQAGDSRWEVTEDGVRSRIDARVNGKNVYIDDGSGHFHISDHTHTEPDSAARGGDGKLTAPMNGVIVSVHKAPGSSVTAGETIIVMEAMKMEHALKAPFDGVVTEIRVSEGDQVRSASALAILEAGDV